MGQKLIKINDVIIKRYQLGDEPEILCVYKMGFDDCYFCFWDRGYEGANEDCHIFNEKQIQNTYNIDINATEEL